MAGKGMPRTGGIQKGTLNKSTIKKLADTSRQIAEVRKLGKKLAIEALDDLMNTAMSTAALYQPANKGEHPRDNEQFREWLLVAGRFAKALAEYQSPKLRGIFQSQTPVLGAAMTDVTPTIDQAGNVVEIKDPVILTRMYLSEMKRVG